MSRFASFLAALCAAVLMGACGWPTVPDHIALWGMILKIRQVLDLWANVRPARLLAGIPTPLAGRGPEDVDMIFVVADARTARLLIPQFTFYSAGDIPTYATADIFDPASTQRDTDLNGLIFADMPSLLAPDDSAASLAKEWRSFWPQRAGQLRLYSMGIDAYNLVGSLFTGESRAWPMRGLSGDLSLDAEGRVHRTLPLAQFRNGRPAAIDQPPAAGKSPSDLVGRR